MHKLLTLALFLLSIFLTSKIFTLEDRLKSNERNTAIAILSAEAANNKVGAIAPYFRRNDAVFAKSWSDTTNMPAAVFPSEAIDPIKKQLEFQRQSLEMKKMTIETFGVSP